MTEPTQRVYVYYYLDGQIQFYQPIETWSETGFHILGLHYHILNLESNSLHIFEIRIKTEGGTGTINIGDSHVVLSGIALATSEEWDGTLSFNERFNLEFGRAIEVPYFEVTASVSIDGFLAPEFNETLSLELGRTMNVSFNDEFEILGLLDLYELATEDELNTFITEDGQSLIVTEYTRDFINGSSEE